MVTLGLVLLEPSACELLSRQFFDVIFSVLSLLLLHTEVRLVNHLSGSGALKLIINMVYVMPITRLRILLNVPGLISNTLLSSASFKRCDWLLTFFHVQNLSDFVLAKA